MKRFFALLCALVLLPVISLADYEHLPDVSGLSYLELMYMYGSVKRALWACEEWSRVEVPAGVYKIGEDIPAGQWSIQAKPGATFMIYYGTAVDRTGAQIDEDSTLWFGWLSSDVNDNMLHQLDIILEDGCYIDLHGPCTFYTYTGKSAPDFKFD